jgi:Raf kinase inhibitor-like YbhB/YbcL family protein
MPVLLGLEDPMRAPLPYDFMPSVPSFRLESEDIREGELIPDEHVYDKFGLTGKDRSPHLRWSGFPANTRGFAVTCLDVDVLTGSGFWHWMLYDLPAAVTELPTGAGSAGAPLPGAARHARSDYGDRCYGGPAPAKGDEPHRYVFAVHALDCERLDVEDDATPAVVGYTMMPRTVARALLIPVFGH